MRALLILSLLAAFVCAQQEPTEVQKLLQEVQKKRQAGDNEGALVDIEKAIELDPDLIMPYYIRAQVRQALHDYDGALEDLTKTSEALKRINARGVVEVINGRAILKQTMGDLKGAMEDYSTLTVYRPESVSGWLSRARIKFALGDEKGAEDDMEAAIYCDESNPDVFMARGRWRMQQGKMDEAYKLFKQAAAIAPTDPRMLFTRGRFFLDAGDHEKAFNDLKMAAAADSTHHEYAQFYLCLVQRRLGRAEAGNETLKKYLESRANKEDWFAEVARFLSGQTSEEAFFKATQTENKWLTRERECEAYFYAGYLRLIAGENAKAKEYFEKCRATGVTNFIEHESAGVELRRLSES